MAKFQHIAFNREELRKIKEVEKDIERLEKVVKSRSVLVKEVEKELKFKIRRRRNAVRVLVSFKRKKDKLVLNARRRIQIKEIKKRSKK